MDSQYEVLNPWAEVDPIPLRGISSRLTELKGKKIGLFHNDKVGAAPIHSLVEAKLKEKYPTLEFSRYLRTPNISMAEMPDKAKFDEWVKGLDTVIFAVGD
jgi:hypothetical protein